MPHRRWVFFENSEVEGLKDEFIAKLDIARKAAGFPFVITSGFRSPQKNQSLVGAVQDSAHTKGLAVDILVKNSHQVWCITEGARIAGISRIGVYVDKNWEPTHIHMDDDLTKVQEVLFIKPEAN